MKKLSLERVADVLVEVAAQLTHSLDTADFLHSMAEYVCEFTRASAAAILLVGEDGRLQHMAATSARAQILHNTAEHFDEGPCQECQRTGEPVAVMDLKQEFARWPVFAPRAVELGYEGVHVLPLRAGEQQVGTLKLFLTSDTRLDDLHLRLVQGLADIFTRTLLHAWELRDTREVNTQLQRALDSRVIIEQAKGALAQHHGIGVDLAFQLLRGYARSHHQRLTDLCRGVVNDPRVFARVARYPVAPEAIGRPE